VITIKVAIMHNFYQQSGGEDSVFKNEIKLLEKNNVEVVTYHVTNDEIQDNFFDKAKAGIQSIWSNVQYRKIIDFLKEHKPDIVHVHNFFPILSPSLYYACKKQKIPVIQTLHNYRIICPAATFLRDGNICEKCLSGSILNSVKYGCYRESKIQTIPLAAMISLHKRTWKGKVNKYISLTEFSKSKFVEKGIDEKIISVKPNFVFQMSENNTSETEKIMLYVGRISKEKGIDNLLNAWASLENRKDYKLYIVGDGPEKKQLEDTYGGKYDIKFFGKKEKEEILRFMSIAKFLIVPSRWYEGFPMTILEAYSVGTPVIASSIGSLDEVVIENKTGFKFSLDDKRGLINSLTKAIELRNYEDMRNNVIKEFKSKYTPEKNFEILYSIYNEVIKIKDEVLK
jgi:glycosyltransferase involved in cell wall biosynthesis